MSDDTKVPPVIDLPGERPEGGLRKLAAIMFTDIKGFSKRMESDEAGTMKMLEVHNRMMQESVTKHRGVVIKTIGDAFLVSFESVVDAVTCAVEAQQRFHSHNAGKLPAEKITVRIGVHLGDIILKDKDVFGDGVNIASRIQSMAEPGGVNISDSVYQQVKNKLDIHVIKLGSPQLKNIKEPVKVYQVIIVPTDRVRGKLATQFYVARTHFRRKRTKQILVTAAGMVAIGVWAWLTFGPRPALNSIAVMPFENLGPTEQEYLADGLSEEIISQLSSLSDVLVISKASSFSFKDSKLDEQAIAKQLGVRYVLKGNVRAAMDQVNVVAYLLDVSSASKVWTETYNLSKNELFQLQYEIPRQVARRFKLQFAARERATTPEVYDLYSRGLFERRKAERESNITALGYFAEALRKDSSFVPSWVALALSQLQNYEWGWDRSQRWLAAAESSCAIALRMDSTNADAYAILGRATLSRGDRQKGVELLRRAIVYDGRNYLALSQLGREYLFNLNDPGEGVSVLRRAQEIEPTNFVLASNLGIAYGMLKNYPAAVGAFRRASILNPNNDWPVQNLATVFEKMGNSDSALFYYRLAAQLNPRRPVNFQYWGELLLQMREYAKAESVLTEGSRHAEGNERILYAIGIARNRQGKLQAAREAWELGLASARDHLAKDSSSLDHAVDAALLCARLGKTTDAIGHIESALKRDSTESELLFNAARVYAILGDKERMLETFRKARSKNPEYDANYPLVVIDFERYKNDPEFVAIAR